MGEREKETDWKKGGKNETEGRKRQTNVYKKKHRRKHQKEGTNEKTKKMDDENRQNKK